MQQHSELLNEFVLKNATLEKRLFLPEQHAGSQEEILQKIITNDNLINKLKNMEGEDQPGI